MQIGELARRAGVSSDTIRYYERMGLLDPPRRTRGGYRDYGAGAVEDLRFVRKAQAVGLRLRDVREVLEIAAGGRPPCEHVRATVRARLEEVDQRLAELRALRGKLRRLQARLEGAPARRAACRCAAIESL